MTCPMMMSLGIYVLGAADAAERDRVAAHLPGCPHCQAELLKLAPLPSLLASLPGGLPSADGTPAAGSVPGLGPPPARGRAGAPSPAGRRRRLGRAGLAAAACAVAVAAVAGAAGGYGLAPRDAGHRPATVTLRGANPATHVTAAAALTATSWGTSIQLNVNGLPLNVDCRLIVRSRTGKTEVTGVWNAWSKGPVSVPASAAWRPADIASLQVTTATRDLVTIRAAARRLPVGAVAGGPARRTDPTVFPRY
jgi:hypothetical protein